MLQLGSGEDRSAVLAWKQKREGILQQELFDEREEKGTFSTFSSNKDEKTSINARRSVAGVSTLKNTYQRWLTASNRVLQYELEGQRVAFAEIR